MNPFAACIPPTDTAPQQLGQTGDVTVSAEGLQKLTPEKNAQLVKLLANLYPASMGEEDDSFGQYTRILALPCADAEAATGSPDACKTSALTMLKASTLPTLVEFRAASRQSMTLYLPKSLETAAALAQPGSNMAIIDANQAPPKEEKIEGSSLLVGAGLGGATGFLIAGPVGAAVGAGTGALLVKWLA